MARWARSGTARPSDGTRPARGARGAQRRLLRRAYHPGAAQLRDSGIPIGHHPELVIALAAVDRSGRRGQRGRLTGLHYLAAGVELLADRCLAGITANEAALRETAANSAGLATALSPYLGYAAASELARDAQACHRPVRELAQERGLLPAEVIDALLADPHRLTGTACPQDATATRLSAEPPTTMTGGTA